MVTLANRQSGVSLPGLLAVAVVLVLCAIVGLKVIPVYIEDQTIKSQLVEIAHDPELKDAPVSTIRLAFSKRAMVSDISAVKAEDIEINKDTGGLSLSVSYTVKKPLFGNVSLLFEFNSSSEK